LIGIAVHGSVRDDDPAGDGAMNRLIDRARMAAIEAMVPSPQCEDFNEDLRNFDINALRGRCESISPLKT
jgi:hypothetical protein